MNKYDLLQEVIKDFKGRATLIKLNPKDWYDIVIEASILCPQQPFKINGIQVEIDTKISSGTFYIE